MIGRLCIISLEVGGGREELEVEMSVQGEGRSSKGTTQGREEEEPEDSQNVPYSKLRAMKRVGDGKSGKLGDLVTGV